MEHQGVRSSSDLGLLVRRTRIALELTQEQLAMAAGTGTRFVSDLEGGKPTCEVGKTLAVLSALGIRVDLQSPVATASERSARARARTR